MKHQVKLCKCEQCKQQKKIRNNLKKIWIKKFRTYNKNLCKWKDDTQYPTVCRYTD